MKKLIISLTLLTVIVALAAPASGDRVVLYTPDFFYTIGTSVKQNEWIAQPFHVPYDAYADYWELKVGKASDSTNGMFLRVLKDDGINHGTNPPTWPGASIAEWGGIHPAGATLNWVSFQSQPVLLKGNVRYWAIFGTYDSGFVGQIAYSGGDQWGIRSYNQASTWQNTGFRFAIKVSGNAAPVPEPASGAALLSLALMGICGRLLRSRR